MVNRITRWKVLVGILPVIIGTFLYTRFPPRPKVDLTYVPTLNQPIEDLSYIINLRPDLDNFTFEGEVEIRFKVKQKISELILNAKLLKTQGRILRINGTDFSNSLKQKRNFNEKVIKRDLVVYKFNQVVEKGTSVTLVVSFIGKLNDKMTGFYRSKYTNKVTGEKEFMVSTQMEPAHARTVFPCIDEPAEKATFKLVVDVPNKLDIVSNTVEQATLYQAENLKEGHKRVIFFETLPMSTYLVAFAIGKFEYIEKELYDPKLDSSIKIRVYTTEGLSEQGEFALDVAAKVLDLFRKLFGISYPMTKLDLIAIPDFDAGAMENWGLITFRPNLLLFDPNLSTLTTKQMIASVVAHEIAHQWFGNLVTMHWWSDLWLNEGFATWAGNYAVDKIFPEWDFWVEFTVSSTESALALDSKINSHPVEVAVFEVDKISEIFDDISYNKGACLIRMLAEYVGEDNFFKGVHAYLIKYALRNARTMDLWDSIGTAAGKDVETFMTKWTGQVGFPLIRVTSMEGFIWLSQRRFMNQPVKSIEYLSYKWQVPLKGITAGDGFEINEFLNVRKKLVNKFPGVYKLNRNFTGLYRVQYDVAHLYLIISTLEKNIDAFSVLDKINLISDVSALSKAQLYPTSMMLELFKAFKKERNYYVWKQLVTYFDHFQQTWALQPDPLPNLISAFKLELFQGLVAELGWEKRSDDTEQVQMLRALAIYHAGTSGDETVRDEARSRFNEIVSIELLESIADPNLIKPILTVVLLDGKDEDYQRVKRLYLEATNFDHKLTALTALGSVKNEELLKETLVFCLSDDVRLMDLASCVDGVSRNPMGRRLAWSFLTEHWDSKLTKYVGSFSVLPRLLRSTAGRATDTKTLEEFIDFFSVRDVSEFQRTCDQILDSMKDAHAWLRVGENSVRDYFSHQTLPLNLEKLVKDKLKDTE